MERQANGCTCPILDGFLIRGSSCPLHGLPMAYWPGSITEAKANGSCGNAWLQKKEYTLTFQNIAFQNKRA